MSYHVYVCYDAARRPLYVGRTGNLRQRMSAHDSSSPWMKDCALISVLPFATYDEASRGEGDRIATLRPRHNRHLTSSWKRSVAEAMEDVAPEPPTACERRRSALAALRSGRAA